MEGGPFGKALALCQEVDFSNLAERGHFLKRKELDTGYTSLVLYKSLISLILGAFGSLFISSEHSA
jgi:hypothetical protein